MYVYIALILYAYLSGCVCVSVKAKQKDDLVALSPGVWLLLGLSAFSVAFSDKEKHTGWSYNIGWVAFLLCGVATIYFIAAGIVRLRCKHHLIEGEDADYQPLQQVESAGTQSSDSTDDDNDQ